MQAIENYSKNIKLVTNISLESFHRSSYYLEHILNVCDFGADDVIEKNFNVIHISMSDDNNTNIKQVSIT